MSNVKERVKIDLKENKFAFCIGYLEDVLVHGLMCKYGFTKEEAEELVEMVVQKYIEEK